MEYYYYFENDQELGPFSMEELRDKRIKKSMLLWKEGMPYWEKAETFDELKHIIFSEPPPIRKIEPISTVDFSSDETELKILKNNDSDSKFDLTYKREQDAIIIGITIIIVSLFLVVFKPFKMDTNESYKKARSILTIIDLSIRIAIVYWIVQIAKRQNRNQTKWGVLGLFFPSISLIIIGFLKKIKKPISKSPLIKDLISLIENFDPDNPNDLHTDNILVNETYSEKMQNSSNAELEKYILEYNNYCEVFDEFFPFYASIELNKRKVLFTPEIMIYLDSYAQFIGHDNYEDLIDLISLKFRS